MDTSELYTYDIETYPNVFTCSTKHFDTGEIYVHEWSERRNDMVNFVDFLRFLMNSNSTMVGFNNLSFDYPVLHYILELFAAGITIDQLFAHVQKLINTPWDQRFSNIIWRPLIRQIDLLKINHFDNVARATSLKMLEFNMRSATIQDLPYPPGTIIPLGELDNLVEYNIKDVNETEKFMIECFPAIELREELTQKFGKDFTNHNDTKIGKDYFIMELEKNQEGICFRQEAGRRVPNQTPRASIALGEVILPYIKFDHPEFQRIHNWFNDRVITKTKGSIDDLSCTIDGFTFVFGTGGIHGSIKPSVIESDDDHVILDVDVASYYPNLAIVNGLYPEHLSTKFCEIYEDIYNQRKQFPKGTPENLVFKLALNGSYGDSNNQYSPFYDPKFTMGITINGQLSLCMLAEQLMKTPGLQLIQINTDGVTFRVPRCHVEHTRSICKWWENVTKLELEEVMYSRFFVRDVNNYIAEYESGKTKLKGQYAYKLGWHQNHSALVVPKAAEAFLIHGIEPAQFLREHDDMMDFLLRTKVPRSSRLLLGTGGNVDIPNPDVNWMFRKKNIGKNLAFVHSKACFANEQPLQNITRYYISNTGGSLVKIMPPLDKDPEDCYQTTTVNKTRIKTLLPLKKIQVERRFCVNDGWMVTPCNDIRGLSEFDINFQWYLNEVEKLISYAR